VSDVPLPDMPPGPSPEEVYRAGLRQRYLELVARIENDATEMDRIKAYFRQLGRGQHSVGTGGVTVSPNTRFDPETAEKVLRSIDPALVAACSVPKLDSTKTREVVSGEIYAQCQKQAGDDKVKIV
jgi:hypothetical protein